MYKISIMLFAIALLTMAFSFTKSSNVSELDIPEDVKSIIDNKCYGCHSPEGKSDKAKDKLMWDELGDLSKVKLVGKLDDISEVTEKGEMPPAKFLENFPDKKLTEEESKLLLDWANSAANKLLE